MIAGISLAVALSAGASPAGAEDDAAAAFRRLRACLTTSSAGAPRTSLVAAVVAVRSVCTAQIRDLRDIRVRKAAGGLSAVEAASVAKDTERALNDEIAIAVSRQTGLTN